MGGRLAHNFACLADTIQNTTQSSATIGRLMNAGLGKKRLTFIECRERSDAHERILSAFPVLKAAGGYKLMQVGKRQQNKLDIISVSLQEYTA